MAGANPERTSTTSEEIKGKLAPVWWKVVEPYVLPRSQIIAADGKIYLATSRGLYAFNADTGADLWVYPTELPLADTPTYDNGTLYIGGFDKYMHAVDSETGLRKWVFLGGQGFQTTPLIVNGIVYAGNRDGYFYAINASDGTLKWKYKTDGPIMFGAAFKNSTVFFASNDSRAYALDANSGSLKWRTDKLPGGGFYSWWPVIYSNYVIFAGGHYYRAGGPGENHFMTTELSDINPNYSDISTKGKLYGPLVPSESSQTWAHGYDVMDTSKSAIQGALPLTEYFETKPWRRTLFVLDMATGKEYTTDFDNDGKPEFAPFTWNGGDGTQGRYPPLVGPDGVVYISNTFESDTAIPDGGLVGWKIGTPYISLIGNSAMDEFRAYTFGGNVIYDNLCCDRSTTAYDISTRSEWSYYGYNLHELISGYNVRYYNPRDLFTRPDASYAGVAGSTITSKNGAYGFHGDTNPPTPYRGKLYTIRSNAIVVFGNTTAAPKELPWAKIITPATVLRNPIPSETDIKSRLEAEVQKIVNAGHLKPGYMASGLLDRHFISKCGDNFADYWHNPAETLYILARTLPHLNSTLAQQVKTYMKNEFTNFPPYTYNHVGWKDGKNRSSHLVPPENLAAMNTIGPKINSAGFGGLMFPYNFYGMWMYAKGVGLTQAETASMFNAAKNSIILMSKFNNVPAGGSAEFTETPFVHNAYIAGYYGYMQLEKMTGTITDITKSTKYSTYQTLLTQRGANFSKEMPERFVAYNDPYRLSYCRSLGASRNFMYMVPELAEYLSQNALSKVQLALTEFDSLYPYWFVSRSETEFGEGILRNLYDYNALFNARAKILRQPYTELVKYIDIPGVEIGDLYYIDNLVLALEATGNPGTTLTPSTTNTSTPTPNILEGDANGDKKVDETDYSIWLTNYGKSVTTGAISGDFNRSGQVDGLDYVIWLNN